MLTGFAEKFFEYVAPLPANEKLLVHPERWCLSYEQLLDVDRLARETFGSHDYPIATMRDICDKIIVPRCRESGTSYALSINPQGLAVDCFVTHSWDGQFASFVQSICQVFQTTVKKPNLWICSFAINQEAADLQVGSGEDSLDETPFVQALKQAKSFCVVRNSNTDLYSRIWCVCELMYAKQMGLFPKQTYVTGPDVFAKIKSSCVDASSTKAEDKRRILRVMLASHNKSDIDSIVQVFRTHGTPQKFPEITRQAHLKTILHPLNDLDRDLMAEHLKRFQPGTRQWTIDSFDEWVTSNDGGKHRVFVLTAQAGVGKTGIVCNLVHQRKHLTLAHHFCRHDDSRRRDPKQMLLSLAYQIACHLPEYGLQLEEIIASQEINRSNLLNDFNIISLFDTFLTAPLGRVPRPNVTHTQPHVIFIDALDECDEEGKNEMLLCIQRHFHKLPVWVRIYVTTRPETPIMDKLKKFSPRHIEPDESNNRADLKLFFQDLLEQVGVEELTRNTGRQQQAVRALVDKTGGLFIYAIHLANMARSAHDGGDAITLEHLETLPEGLEEFYETQFERLLAARGGPNSIEWKIVQFSTTAREPLHVELIEALVDCNRKERIPALHNLSSFFRINANRKLQIYHKSFRDWVTDKERQDSEYYVDQTEIEQQFASWCLRCLEKELLLEQQSGGRRDASHSTTAEGLGYVLKHGISHLLAAGNKEDARRLLLNVSWLMARVSADGGPTIDMDYGMLSEDWVINLVGRAIGLSLHAILMDPRQLPSQLVGRLLSSVQGSSRTSHSEAKIELACFIQSIKNYDSYGFSWWCPIAPTWEQADQSCVRVLEGHTKTVFCVKWSNASPARLASGSNDTTIRLWNPSTAACEVILKGHTGAINSIAWSSDDSFLVTASNDKTIRRWCSLSGDLENVIHGIKVAPLAVVVTADSKVVASQMETIQIYQRDGTGIDGHLVGHASTVIALDLLNGGPMLASASEDRTVGLWDIEQAACLGLLEGHTGSVRSVKWSPNNGMLASCSEDWTVRVWDPASQTTLQNHETEDGVELLNIAWDSCSDQLVVGARSGKNVTEVRLLNVHFGFVEKKLGWDFGRYITVDWSFNRIATAAQCEVRICDPTLDASPFSPRPDPGKSELRRASSENCGDNQSKNVRKSFEILSRSDSTWRGTESWTRAWSPNGLMYATLSIRFSIQLWSTSTGERTLNLSGHTHKVSFAAFSSDSNCLASCSWDKTARLYDVTSGECLHNLAGHESGVRLVQWSNQDRLLASSSHDLSVRIWCVSTGECLHALRSHRSLLEGNARSLLWMPSDNSLAVGHEDGSIVLWDSATWECQRSFKDGVILDDADEKEAETDGEKEAEEGKFAAKEDEKERSYADMLSLVCSPDGNRLAVGSQDHNIYVYDLLRPQCLHTLVGHEHGVTHVIWSNGDGSPQQLLSRCSGSIRIWDANSGRCIRILEGTDSIPRFFPSSKTSAIPRDLSSLSRSSAAPVGIPSKNATIFGTQASACFNNTGVVKFFVLKGEPEA